MNLTKNWKDIYK